MTPSAKTIQIFLPTGNPRGIRCAEMTTRTVRLIEIPRVHFKEFLEMPDAMQVGLYFLVGSQDDEQSNKQVYIGQTGELRKRLETHNNEKDFWERAFVMLSTNNSITQTHTLYLEHKSIEITKSVGRYELINGNNGSLPHTPEPLKADCDELFHTLKILLSTLGQPIFESLRLSKEVTNKTAILSNNSDPMLFYCRGLGADATGYYDDDGFVILAGSKIRKDPVPSYSIWGGTSRTKMIKEKKFIEYDDKSYKLVDNYLFNTPSGAAEIVLGRTANGWLEWKNKEGKTLNDIYRSESKV